MGCSGIRGTSIAVVSAADECATSSTTCNGTSVSDSETLATVSRTGVATAVSTIEATGDAMADGAALDGTVLDGAAASTLGAGGGSELRFANALSSSSKYCSTSSSFAPGRGRLRSSLTRPITNLGSNGLMRMPSHPASRALA